MNWCGPLAMVAVLIAGGAAGAQSRPVPGSVPHAAQDAGLVAAIERTVAACWNVGALTGAAQTTVVTLRIALTPDARPGLVTLAHASGDDVGATEAAFQAARRAVLRCGQAGFPVPADRYDQWREIEMVFDPTGMRGR